MHTTHSRRDSRDFVDHKVATIAAAQHGVVHVDQLAACGMSSSSIHRRATRGLLHRVHARVYAVGHPRLSFEGRVQAALLSAGSDAFVTGTAALHLRGIVHRPPTIIDVVVIRHTRPRRGSRIIRSTRPQGDEWSDHRGFATATPARALLDMAARTPVLKLNRLIYECAYHDLGVVVDIDTMLARYPRRQGHRRLDEANARHRAGSAGARSAFEEIVIARLRAEGVPEFRINSPINVRDGAIEADLHWQEFRLVVEIDGVPHAREESKRRDLRRTRRLRAAGWSVLRVGHASLDRDIARVVRRLRDSHRSRHAGTP